jgi:alkaline phosphatase D
MTDSHLAFYSREDRPWPNDRLTNAAIVGHTDQTSCRLWIRVYARGKHWLAVSKKPFPIGLSVETQGDKVALKANDVAHDLAFQEAHTFEGTTDFTHVFNVSQLEAGTTYYYCVVNDDPGRRSRFEIGREAPHSFRTADAITSELAIGIYSCHMPYGDGGNLVNMHMWTGFADVLNDVRADLLLGIGDQVYSDGHKDVSIWRFLKSVRKEIARVDRNERIEIMKSWYRDIYRGYWGPLVLRRVLRSFPTYMVWDDHEIMDGWGSDKRSELSDVLDTIWESEKVERNLELADDMFRAAKEIYLEYQHCHNPSTKPNVFDYSFARGPFHFYVLDGRGHRNFEAAPGERILGKEQQKRFEDFLAHVPANARAVFVVTPVPVVHVKSVVADKLDLRLLGLADDLRDSWEHKEHEQELGWLLDTVTAFSNAARIPIVFLSGDVHLGSAFRLSCPKRPDARLYQLTSSAITYHVGSVRPLLRLAVAENGELLSNDAMGRVFFHRLHLFNHNNFGILRLYDRGDPESFASWDLYGNSGEGDRILRMQRIHLFNHT